MTAAELQSLLPEIVLIVAAVAIYIGGAFFASRGVWRWIAGGALLAAASLWTQTPNTGDELALYVRWFALAAGGLLLLSGSRPLRFDGTSEYVGSLLLTLAGLMLAAGAEDIILLFVSLELISIPTYVLLYLGRNDAASQESAAKYFFLGVLSSAILLYGFSFLYGATGSMQLSALGAASSDFAIFARLALALIFAGLCFKVAAVPFHFYAPDVYQGTTYPNAALLSVVPKAAGFVVMVRIIVEAMPELGSYSWGIVLGVALLTMTFGNVMALWQDDFRRLLAYSSIAQAGYMLLAVAIGLVGSGEWDGIGALWFYLSTYAAATIGAFAVMEYLGRADRRLDAVDDLAGLGRTRPAAAAMMAICMFSLAGVPPLAGFWGKLLVFGGALNVEAPAAARWWFTVAAVVAVLNAAVAAAYYLRIVAAMYFRIPLATPPAEGGRGALIAAVVCAMLVVGVGLYPGPLIDAGDFREREARVPLAPPVRSNHSVFNTGGASGTLRSRRHTFSTRKKTATPTCPTVWSGGNEQSSCPKSVCCLFVSSEGIIAAACVSMLSYHIELNEYMRKRLL